MANIKNFSENLEKDFERLTAAINEKRGEEKIDLPEKQIVKRSLEIFLPPEMTATFALSTKEPPTADSEFFPSYMKAGHNDPAAAQKIETLIDLALQEGLTEAWRAARREGSFVIDAFHDALADKLLPELKKRGVIKD